MTGSWDRAKEILHGAMLLPVEKRDAYLAEACGDDAPLRAEVEGLLRAHDEAGSFLGNVDDTRTSMTAPVVEKAGDQVGRYRLLQQIGEGGFGVVYMAEQEEPIRRRVALKIIKLGMDTQQVIGRFEAERQALAVMDHPGIARVFDAGATATGRPYFVMELVKGLPITEYCDQRRLTIPERLQLFVQVCRAVQHAHQKGIVHRDIKPSNVLVTHVNDRPTVKVIDFGIAKATDQHLTENTVFTMLGQLIGTPAYMSPEQADPLGEDVDTRSDVYSLGVLLYELVTGTTPFRMEQLRGAAYDEIRRIIREEDPETASTRVSALGDRLDDTAARRGVDAGRLRTLVQGDLDAILLMALEKDRSRRYPGPNDFARDIEALLGDEPVQARFPSTAYRMRKFVRRNRSAVIAGGLVLSALLLGLVGTTLFAVKAVRAEREARREARTSAQVAAFLEGLFRSNAPASILEKELTAKDILDSGVEDLETKPVGNPLVRARLRTVIGGVYSDQGHFDEAEQQLRTALETYEGDAAADALEHVTCLATLAEVLQQRGAYDAAGEILQRATDLVESAQDADGVRTAQLLIIRGNIQHGRADYDAAVATFRDALARLEAAGESGSSQAASCLLNIANNRFMVGAIAEADSLYERALALEARIHGEDHFRSATPLHNRALIAVAEARFDDARRLEERAFAIRERVLGDHWHTALSLSTLGYLRYVERDLPEARRLLERAVAIDEQHFEPVKYETAYDLDMLGRVYVELGLLDEAEPLLERASSIFDELGTYRAGHTGWLLLGRGDLAAAEESFLATMAQEGDSWFDITVFDCHVGLAEVALARGDREAAKGHLERAVRVGEGRWPGGHPRLREIRERWEAL